jgi:hypothetical protein
MGPQIDGTLLEELVAANTGKNVIAFTHKPVLGDDLVAVENRRLIARQIACLGVAPQATTTKRRDFFAELRP